MLLCASIHLKNVPMIMYRFETMASAARLENLVLDKVNFNFLKSNSFCSSHGHWCHNTCNG